MCDWIDFKALRRQLRIADVLRHYNVVVKVSGQQATGLCPLPNHPTSNDGHRRSSSLSVNLQRDCFQCFATGCRAAGNALDFAVLMEGFNPADPSAFRKGALRVRDVFGLTDTKPDARRRKPRASPTPASPVKASSPLINPPLDFELKDLDETHPYFAESGLTLETVRHFGLGRAAKGFFAGRIAVPLHDPAANLVGYAGLLPDCRKNPAEPLVKLPTDRERNGVRHEFRPSLLLYNAHRIESPAERLILTSGFPPLWWFWQKGEHHVASVFTQECSREQVAIIDRLTTPDARIFIVNGPEEAQWAARVLTAVASARFCKVVTPTGMSAEHG